MPGRFAGFSYRILALAALLALPGPSHPADDARILKPADGTWLQGASVQVIAKAEAGKLVLDGQALAADEPFPGIQRARVQLSPGKHVLRLESPAGTQEVVFHTGNAPPSADSKAYVDHPPVVTECTHCHSISRRGRFRFSGGCQSCHAEEPFIRTHSHEPHELASCGMCHDAHGSAAAKLLTLSKEHACKQCHN